MNASMISANANPAPKQPGRVKPFLKNSALKTRRALKAIGWKAVLPLAAGIIAVSTPACKKEILTEVVVNEVKVPVVTIVPGSEGRYPALFEITYSNGDKSEAILDSTTVTLNDTGKVAGFNARVPLGGIDQRTGQWAAVIGFSYPNGLPANQNLPVGDSVTIYNTVRTVTPPTDSAKLKLLAVERKTAEETNFHYGWLVANGDTLALRTFGENDTGTTTITKSTRYGSTTYTFSYNFGGVFVGENGTIRVMANEGVRSVSKTAGDTVNHGTVVEYIVGAGQSNQRDQFGIDLAYAGPGGYTSRTHFDFAPNSPDPKLNHPARFMSVDTAGGPRFAKVEVSSANTSGTNQLVDVRVTNPDGTITNGTIGYVNGIPVSLSVHNGNLMLATMLKGNAAHREEGSGQ